MPTFISEEWHCFIDTLKLTKRSALRHVTQRIYSEAQLIKQNSIYCTHALSTAHPQAGNKCSHHQKNKKRKCPFIG